MRTQTQPNSNEQQRTSFQGGLADLASGNSISWAKFIRDCENCEEGQHSIGFVSNNNFYSIQYPFPIKSYLCKA